MSEISDIKIHQIMTKEVVAANVNNKFSQVLRFFVDRGINHIPVVDDHNTVVGIISIKDMLRTLYKKSIIEKFVDFTTLDSQVSLENIMTKDPVTVDVASSAESVKALLAKVHFNALPITSEGKLAGIITAKDLIKLRIIKIEGSDYNPI
jgi:acetoin utilization protein AcuB